MTVAGGGGVRVLKRVGVVEGMRDIRTGMLDVFVARQTEVDKRKVGR